MSQAAIVSIVVLAGVRSALGCLLMVGLVAEIGPVKETAITYVNPAVAIITGVLVLGERVTAWTIIGLALVVAGSYLVTRPRQEPIAAERPEAANRGGSSAPPRGRRSSSSPDRLDRDVEVGRP
jgi:drug/metabolite transporter (DMT)-like permease